MLSPSELADIREVIHSPGWRILVRRINELEEDSKNRVLTVAAGERIEKIKQASGQLMGVQDAIKVLNGMVNEAENT